MTTEMTPLQQACLDLNAAIDAYWNSDYGVKFTGMGENFIIKITEAQQQCRAALEAEGIALGSNP